MKGKGMACGLTVREGPGLLLSKADIVSSTRNQLNIRIVLSGKVVL